MVNQGNSPWRIIRRSEAVGLRGILAGGFLNTPGLSSLGLMRLVPGTTLQKLSQIWAQAGRFSLFSRNLADMGGISSDL